MKAGRIVLAALVACLAGTILAAAQDAPQTETLTAAPATINSSVSGTIVFVAGNDLIVKLESGDMVDLQVRPEATTTTEDGAEITLHDAKPGMRLSNIPTIAAPRMVETIYSIRGKVWHVQPPSLLILTLQEGNRVYRVPEGQRFNLDGVESTIWELRPGQDVSATVVRTLTETVARQSKEATPTATPPLPSDTPAVEGALLLEEALLAEARPLPELPKTGSMVPLLGLCGLLLTGVSLGWSLIRS